MSLLTIAPLRIFLKMRAHCSRWKWLIISIVTICGASSTEAQVALTPQRWRFLFFLNFGLGAEWQRCKGCPGHFDNPLLGPVVKIGAGASNRRFALDESLIAWWQVLPTTIESRPPAYKSQYLMTEAWYESEDDAVKLMVGVGAGKHSSSYGDDGRGSAGEAGVDIRLLGTSDVSLRWQTHIIKSLNGTHQAFPQSGLPADAYRPLLVITTLSLWGK